MVHVAVNKYDFEKNQHFRVRFWGEGGGHQKAYAFINVDNCERPLIYQHQQKIDLNWRLWTDYHMDVRQ